MREWNMGKTNLEMIKSGSIMLHPVRFKILDTLEKKGEMYIDEIAKNVDTDRRLVSFHLGVLQNHGFLESSFKIIKEPRSKGKAGRFFKITGKYEETKSKLSDLFKS
jgi:DNA-binding transcriptional ArsR family regulator